MQKSGEDVPGRESKDLQETTALVHLRTWCGEGDGGAGALPTRGSERAKDRRSDHIGLCRMWGRTLNFVLREGKAAGVTG